MRESDIRPQTLLDHYLKLCREDAEIYFNGQLRHFISCPACDSREVKLAFVKWGFNYVCCERCGTLYQSPRPGAEVFQNFYKGSPSAHYWAKVFFPVVAENRRRLLFAPKVKEIAVLLKEHQIRPSTVIDVGAGYGLFLEEWRQRFPQNRLVGIEPHQELADHCRQKGFEVMIDFVEDLAEGRLWGDLVVSLEVIEHVYNPLVFCRALRRLLQPDGHLLLTGLTVDGFDIQILWDRSNVIAPPHHINFISLRGFSQLMERAGFEVETICTPGWLDVEIVRNAVRKNPELTSDNRFLQHLMAQAEETQVAFQTFLRQQGLSSHCWVLARAV